MLYALIMLIEICFLGNFFAIYYLIVCFSVFTIANYLMFFSHLLSIKVKCIVLLSCSSHILLYF